MIADVDQDGQTISADELPHLSVEENIRIYGGDIMYEEQRKDKTYRWDMTDDFKQDIRAMWDICRGDARLWNTQIGVLEAADRLAGSTDNLTVSVPKSDLEEAMKKNGGKPVFVRGLLSALRGQGLLTQYECGDDTFSVTYKNLQVKYCLTVAGQALEMKMYLAALETTEKDGATKTYNDVMNGVYIDWDGEIHAEPTGNDTENEIDVLMMHGMVPVFVSCKNGFVDPTELYKLNTVATRFGGKYAKKVLVATSLDDSAFSESIRQRAKDMGIRLVEGRSQNGRYKELVDMNDQEINQVIRSLWLN